MPVFNTHREIGNGKTYDTLIINRMAETSTSETEAKDLLNAAHRGYTESILTQEEVDEEMKTFVTKQQENWAGPIDVECSLTKRFPKGEYQC